MTTSNPTISSSIERARRADLESVIKKLSGSEEPRRAKRQQVEHRRAALLNQIGDPAVVQLRLERIMQGNELTDVAYLAQGARCAMSVCRIVIKREERTLGFGTGFLVGPGVVLTNHHVLSSIDDVRGSLAEFRFERDWKGRELNPVAFRLLTQPEPIIFKDLDMALVAVEPTAASGENLAQFGWLGLNPQPGKAIVGEYLTIIQHPNGERKQVCVRENKLLKYDENNPFVWYQTDTLAGSSGSPVFNNSWEVVALHHSSVPKTKKVGGRDVWLTRDGRQWSPEMGDDQVAWLANEGVRVSRILEYLQTQRSTKPIANLVLNASQPQEPEALAGASNGTTHSQGYSVISNPDGTTRILIPVEIGIKVGLQNGAAGGQAKVALPPTTTPPPAGGFSQTSTAPAVVEKVIIDQTNYNEREGFNPNFLSERPRNAAADDLSVPLPKVKDSKFGKPLRISGTQTELKYYNYSLALNPTRRLAFFSAANVDADSFRGNRDADGDKWYLDKRVTSVDPKAQLGEDFYGRQKQFEADRTNNPFDRGHLTRRSDLQWGSNDTEAKRNGDESYHFTNCSPQHWRFNQNSKGSGLWFRLETSALQSLDAGQRLCIINGPIFDAPLCKPGADGRLRLDLHGKRHPDGTFGGVKIPKQFFKVIAYEKGGELVAKAFVVTQEDLLATIDRYYESEEALAILSDLEVHLYQVKLTDLEDLTGLDFGSLAKQDSLEAAEALTTGIGRPIESASDLSF